jgi:O-antigen/teichoic acid export membrane protein
MSFEAVGGSYPRLQESGRRMRGVTAGAVVFVGVAVANIANAGFNLIAGRWLGPGRYGDLAALLAVLGLISFPLGAAQYNIAAWAAALAARREVTPLGALARRSAVAATTGGMVVALLLVLLTVPIKDVLGVSSGASVVLLAPAAFAAALTPPFFGLAQGLERFVLFSWVQAAGPVVRMILVVAVLAGGAGVVGAMGATVVGTFVGVIAAAFVLRGWLVVGRGAESPISRRTAFRAIGPVTLGIIALTSLTTIDVVVAKLSFSSEEAGVYSAASLVARLLLYVPAAIASVLLPKVSSRSASGRASADILLKSLVVTAVLCVLATTIYATIPRALLETAYGSKYSSAESFLWLFGVAMTGFALVNVLFVYHVARNTTVVPFVMVGAAVVQVALFSLVHATPRELLVVSSAVSICLLGVLLWITRRSIGHLIPSRA